MLKEIHGLRSGASQSIAAEIVERLGSLPPFFQPALSDPVILDSLWQQMRTSYLNNPIADQFKERLASYLACYCASSYCLNESLCKLSQLGMSGTQILELLELPMPADMDQMQPHLQLFAEQTDHGWPPPNTQLEESLIFCAAAIFLDWSIEPIAAILTRYLGKQNYQYLLLLIAFLKTSYIWLESHPEVSILQDPHLQMQLELIFEEEPTLKDFSSYYRRCTGQPNHDSRRLSLEVERLESLQDAFLSTVSHELRAPMANIRLAVDMLKRSGNQEKLNLYLRILEAECAREINLINNLLDLQKKVDARTPLPLQQLDIAAWLPGILQTFALEAELNQQSLCFETMPSQLTATTNNTVLERIVTELVKNACQYTPAKGKIFLQVSLANSNLILRIENTSIDIPPEELTRIFDKFYRIPNNDPWKRGGTGLGLALVKRAVDKLRGKIYVESRNQITVFQVELPQNESFL